MAEPEAIGFYAVYVVDRFVCWASSEWILMPYLKGAESAASSWILSGPMKKTGPSLLPRRHGPASSRSNILRSTM